MHRRNLRTLVNTVSYSMYHNFNKFQSIFAFHSLNIASSFSMPSNHTFVFVLLRVLQNVSDTDYQRMRTVQMSPSDMRTQWRLERLWVLGKFPLPSLVPCPDCRNLEELHRPRPRWLSLPFQQESLEGPCATIRGTGALCPPSVLRPTAQSLCITNGECGDQKEVTCARLHCE